MLLLVFAGGFLVVKVVAHAAKFQKFFLDAGKMQSVGKFAVLVSPGSEVFVVAVHLDDVVLPKSHVAAAKFVDALSIPQRTIFL